MALDLAVFAVCAMERIESDVESRARISGAKCATIHVPDPLFIYKYVVSIIFMFVMFPRARPKRPRRS